MNPVIEDSAGQPGVLEGIFGNIKKVITGTGSSIKNAASSLTGTQPNPPQTYTSQYGGAKSRRRKCNKKHRHTKSCRKYVKKGRKTRKH